MGMNAELSVGWCRSCGVGVECDAVCLWGVEGAVVAVAVEDVVAECRMVM